jgi:hypothetical protein
LFLYLICAALDAGFLVHESLSRKLLIPLCTRFSNFTLVHQTSLAIDSKGRLHLATSQGNLRTLNISEIIRAPTPPPSSSPTVDSPTVTLSADCIKIEAVAALSNYIVTVDSTRSIHLSNLCASDDEGAIGEVVQKLPAHGSPVLGVTALKKPNTLDASFCTWSAGGSVLFWSHDGVCKKTIQVPLEQLERADAETNELKTVQTSADASFACTGDRYGIIRYILLPLPNQSWLIYDQDY